MVSDGSDGPLLGGRGPPEYRPPPVRSGPAEAEEGTGEDTAPSATEAPSDPPAAARDADLEELPPPGPGIEAADLPSHPSWSGDASSNTSKAGSDLATTKSGTTSLAGLPPPPGLPQPPAPEPGEPDQYRSPRGSAMALQAVLGVMMVVSAIAMAFMLVDYRLWSRVDSDPLSVRIAQLDGSTDRLNAMAMIQLVLIVLIVIGFMVWTRRLYRNVPVLERRHKAGWATWGWLVPFVNWVRPWQVLDDVWKATEPQRGTDGRASGWQTPRSSRLVNLWWGGLVIMSLVGLIAQGRDADVESAVSDRRTSALWFMVVDALQLVVAALGFLVVASLTHRQVTHAARPTQPDPAFGHRDTDLPKHDQRSPRTTGAFAVLTVVAIAAIPSGYFAVIDRDQDPPDASANETAGDEESSDDRAVAEQGEGEGVLTSDLEVGDCMNSPPEFDPLSEEMQVILAMETVPCTSPHDMEAVARTNHVAAPDAPYPGDDEVGLSGLAACRGPTDRYIGRPIFESGLGLSVLQPTADSWAIGDRSFVCMAHAIDDSSLESTVRDSGGIVPDGSNTVFSLTTGQCFDDSINPVVKIIDCDVAHDNEVYNVIVYPGSEDDPYPGSSRIEVFATQECSDAFDQSVDATLADALEFGWIMAPVMPELWAAGYRNVICTLWDRNLVPLNQSQVADGSPVSPVEEHSPAAEPSGDGSLGVVQVRAGAEIQIRSLNAISGDVAFLGVPNQRAVQQAINDYGQIKGFNVSMGRGLDDLCSFDGGQAAAQAIVADEQVIGVIGTSCSGAAFGASPLISEAGMVMVSGSNTSPFLTSDRRGNAGDDYNVGYYRTAHNDASQGAAMAQFVFEDLGFTTAAAIHDGDPYTNALAQAFAHTFEELGGEITGITAVDMRDTNMVPVLTEIAASSPEALFFPVFMPPGDLIAGQAPDVAGLEDIVLLAADGLLINSFLQSSQSEGMFLTGPDLRFDTNTNQSTGVSATEFLATYEADYGEAPTAPFWAHSYDATTMLLDAIDAASLVDGDTLVIDRAGVRGHLDGISDFEGIIGTINCDAFGDCGTQRITVIEHLDSGDLDASKANIVYEYAPTG